MQQAALFRRERQLVAKFVLWLLLFCRLGFGVLSALSARSAGDFGVSFVWIDRVLLRVILPQIALITQRNAASCIISQIKTGWLLWLLELL